MNKSWWRSKDELVPEQVEFIKLPPTGKYSLIGPPGSGKTNLLLLRAQYIAGTGETNVLVITFTKALCNFIQSGIGASGLIQRHQIKTFHSWAGSHVQQHLGNVGIPGKFDDSTRVEILSRVKEANAKRASAKLYSAILVDEAQDLTADELDALLCLSDNICICGDDRQGIYQKDGLAAIDKLNLITHKLTSHFRIGQKIAKVADKLLPPNPGMPSLEDTANYNPNIHGLSSAKLHTASSRDKQFNDMVELIRVQLDAFKDDNIGVFCGLRASANQLRDDFDATDLGPLVAVHGLDGDASFTSDKRIHVLTLHSSKGTEFRAVHILGAEELASYPLNKVKLAYTGVTRARTALNVFRAARTSDALENAFSEPKLVDDLDDLF